MPHPTPSQILKELFKFLKPIGSVTYNFYFFCYNPVWTRGASLVDYAKWLPNKKLLHESTHSYLPKDDSKKKCPKNKTYWNIGAKVTGYIKGMYI